MANVVLLNNDDHATLKVMPAQGAAYGDAINQALIFPTEFEEAQRDYAILFRSDAALAPYPVALLGLDRDENLFLDAAGWSARYVPALQRRGPFSIGVPRAPDGDAETGGAEPMIHVDLDDARVGRDDGLPLFLEHGGQAPYLDHVAAVLRVIYAGIEAQAPMLAAFTAADLLEPASIAIELGDGLRYDLPDVLAITPERIARLDGEAVQALHRSGFLPHAIHAAASLGNINRLIELKRHRGAGA